MFSESSRPALEPQTVAVPQEKPSEPAEEAAIPGKLSRFFSKKKSRAPRGIINIFNRIKLKLNV